jgi:hypothetical protein
VEIEPIPRGFEVATDADGHRVVTCRPGFSLAVVLKLLLLTLGTTWWVAVIVTMVSGGSNLEAVGTIVAVAVGVAGLAVPCLAGFLLLAHHVYRLEPDALRVTRALGPLRWRRTLSRADLETVVHLFIPQPRGNAQRWHLELRLRERMGSVSLPTHDHDAGLWLGTLIADWAGLTVVSNRVKPPRSVLSSSQLARRHGHPLRWLICVGCFVVLLAVPAVRGAVYGFLLRPTFSYHRSIAVTLLPIDSTAPSVLALIRLVNTLPPGADDLLLSRALESLGTIAGPPFGTGSGSDMLQAVGEANRWAARRLDRKLDANGGVLDWFALDRAHQADVERLAAAAPREGCDAMKGLATSADSAEELLRSLGPALADRRPISFVIVAEPGSAVCRPEPLASFTGVPLARTVGGAVAVKLWQLSGGGGNQLSGDFTASWSEHARRHHLPPLALPATPEAPEQH